MITIIPLFFFLSNPLLSIVIQVIMQAAREYCLDCKICCKLMDDEWTGGKNLLYCSNAALWLALPFAIYYVLLGKLYTDIINSNGGQTILRRHHQQHFALKKDVFRLVTSVGQRKNSESPWGMEPQTLGFRAPMLYHWAIKTLQWARFITKFIWHASYILLGSAVSIA